MTNREKLLTRISQLSEDDITALLDAVMLMTDMNNAGQVPDCPYCGSSSIIRYGLKHGKQRFLCKSCGKTFLPTTHTIMSMSHYPANVWKEVITDTLRGNAIDYSVKRLGVSHQAVFDMRHKILLALQDLPETKNVCLSEVTELDETFVLESYKGKKLPTDASRKARKHGAKAQKRGISNEYVCICTGIQRKGDAYAASINRAKPDSEEMKALFEGHIASGTLVLCDGLRSYNALPSIAECTVRDCSNCTADESHFYNLNTVNGFHSFIKKKYDFYCGVATKYLNRYNALFAAMYRNADHMICRLKEVLLTPGTHNYYHSNKDVRQAGLLLI